MADYYCDIDNILAKGDHLDFTEAALSQFHYQYHHNSVYREFCDLLTADTLRINNLYEIPFLPIEVFKSHIVKCGDIQTQKVFTSSGTTGQLPSKHFITDLSVYDKSLIRGFERVYGPVSDYCILALLPSYLERDNSSLVYMVRKLMEISAHKNNGFYLYDHSKLAATIKKLIQLNQKTLLIGVSFALLDFSEEYQFQLNDKVIVMETGGMKGRRKEMVREELHQMLCSRFGIEYIHSEYGMTELLSQAYSKGEGKFLTPPWMKVLIREMNDPFSYAPIGKTGAINIIDLANIHSCSFIATQDIGRLNADGTFEVLGRFDHSEIRGCNLMIS